MGKVVLRGTEDGNIYGFDINLSSLDSGVYFLTLWDSKKTKIDIQKLIVVK